MEKHQKNGYFKTIPVTSSPLLLKLIETKYIKNSLKHKEIYFALGEVIILDKKEWFPYQLLKIKDEFIRIEIMILTCKNCNHIIKSGTIADPELYIGTLYHRKSKIITDRIKRKFKNNHCPYCNSKLMYYTIWTSN
ncbi:hypothetical protein [Aureibacter tunicatorum]|uniref:Ribosomal protein L37AE/L43A n=1 Tax=Aureibacter tunicatorum TaxID=866807 RepID=A0AAE3XNX2_9BACT|nr:hypothetical protein [Aureibacter tunicatorum]MDR6241386.1 ribosomal protein L37AE/L43A [Aureibacter tunicatorum]BDD06769.1 hypothetical protein AUTU_42520 [Aureibacter tunicatorum]